MDFELYAIENRAVASSRIEINDSDIILRRITIPFEAIRADTKYTLARESGLKEEVPP